MKEDNTVRLTQYVKDRIEELGTTLERIAATTGPTRPTMRRVIEGLRVKPRTLPKVDHALGWAEGSSLSIMRGGEPVIRGEPSPQHRGIEIEGDIGDVQPDDLDRNEIDLRIQFYLQMRAERDALVQQANEAATSEVTVNRVRQYLAESPEARYVPASILFRVNPRFELEVPRGQTFAFEHPDEPGRRLYFMNADESVIRGMNALGANGK